MATSNVLNVIKILKKVLITLCDGCIFICATKKPVSDRGVLFSTEHRLQSLVALCEMVLRICFANLLIFCLTRLVNTAPQTTTIQSAVVLEKAIASDV